MVSKQHEKRNLTRRKLIDKYMPIVRRIVLQYNRKLPPKIDIDDLVSAGIVGLLRAMEKFDPEKGVNFTSFANYHIKGSILDELRQWDHLTRGERKIAKSMEMTYLDLEKKLNRQPTDEEAAQAMQLPLEKFYKHKVLARLGFLSYEDHWDGEGAEDLLELICHKELKLKLTKAVSRLPQNERVVIDFFYFKGKTMKAAAKFLEVSEGRASQLHKQAMERLAKARRKLKLADRPDS
jgi:RNA polymerase sigma factor for flagellar operon FliA